MRSGGLRTPLWEKGRLWVLPRRTGAIAAMREPSRHSYQYMILLCREKIKHFCASGRFAARVDGKTG